MGKRFLAISAAVIIAITAPFTAYCLQLNTLNGIREAVEGVVDYKCAEESVSTVPDLLDKFSQSAGTYSVDWYYIAFSQYGLDCKNQKSIDALKNKAKDFYSGDPADVKVTDMQRTALALSACGEDITNVNGHNLLADATYNRAKVKPVNSQGINSVAYALLLLDSKNYTIPENAENNREDMIRIILKAELPEGGFALFGNHPDIDITSIAVQALSPYQDRSDVKAVLNKCVSILSSRQDSTGGYKSFSSEISCESTAQVILCLTSMGINPISDSRFQKDGKSVMDGLNVFRLNSGAFCHFKDGKADNMATYQAFCALVSTYRFLNGEKPFYDFSEKPAPNKVEIKNQTDSSVGRKKAPENKIKKHVKKSPSVSLIEEQKPTEKVESITQNTTPESNKKKEKKEKSTVNSTAATESTAETVAHNSKKENKKDIKVENKRNPLYIDFAVFMLAYIVLFALKRRTK